MLHLLKKTEKRTYCGIMINEDFAIFGFQTKTFIEWEWLRTILGSFFFDALMMILFKVLVTFFHSAYLFVIINFPFWKQILCSLLPGNCVVTTNSHLEKVLSIAINNGLLNTNMLSRACNFVSYRVLQPFPKNHSTLFKDSYSTKKL